VLYGMLIGVAGGLVIGLTIGYVAEHVPVPPVLQSVGAALVATVLGAITVALIWFMRPSQTGGLGAVSVGIVEGTLPLVGVLCVLVVVAVHVGLGRLSATLPAVANHRPIVLGCLGGLSGALPVARMMVESTGGL
jgi:hypothetical protein